MPDRNAKAAWVASLAVYCVALACPAVRGADTMHGYQVLALGPAGLLAGHVGWLANPLLFASWAFVGARANPRVAAILAVLALVVASTSVATLHARGLGFEGVTAPATVLFGFWVWLVSIALALVAAILRSVARSAEEARQRELEDERALRELTGPPRE